MYHRTSAPEARTTALTGLVAAATMAACSISEAATAAQKVAVSPTVQTSRAPLCTPFVGRTFEGAVVTAAKLVAATATIPEHCVVLAEMQEDLDFEVRLPTQWNKRTLFVGGGGFDGTIVPPNPDLTANGYATISTNHGHGGRNPVNAEFALDHGMLADYAYLSVPRVLAPAKAILRARYGATFASTKMVYEGCSGGGRQALLQAQRYPELFDGVIARAPAVSFTSMFLGFNRLDKQLSQPGAALSVAKIQGIGKAVTDKCDALDGLADNMIGRPDACKFDPAELACTGAETDACLTPPQVESARAFYAPSEAVNGRYKSPGFLPGGEEGTVYGWATKFRPALAQGYMKYMVTRNPSVDPLQVDPMQHTARLEQLSTMIDATDPDLSRFKARGGKVLLWTGMSDWLISSKYTTNYYQAVVQNSGGQIAADEFIEYYTSPSVQHCSSGTGADKFDLVDPMFDWLEKGIKPSAKQIVATQRELDPIGQRQYLAGTTPPSRPLCQYPKYPKYVGGNTQAASSFVCAAP